MDTDGAIFPFASELIDASLLFLRLWLALLFGWSGWAHVTHPRERAESIGLPPAATFVLGIVEMTASILFVLGFLDQVGALLLLGVMGGAIFKKAFEWKTGFWGQGTSGWYYEVLYALGCFVIFATNGGAYGID
ncbi:MAG: DoxX family protein [Myxococcales bacterium]|nr:DoxX family protein [Myxococcales bacterium]